MQRPAAGFDRGEQLRRSAGIGRHDLHLLVGRGMAEGDALGVEGLAREPREARLSAASRTRS